LAKVAAGFRVAPPWRANMTVVTAFGRVLMSNEVATRTEASTDVYERSLHAEEDAERKLMHSIIKSIVIGIPIGIVVFVGMLAIAIGDDTEWYVWVLLGALMGTIAAVLFGMLGAVTLAAHSLDEIDRDTYAEAEVVADTAATETA
jgi:NO-binding membrane sensor protein with MHYT domain